MNYFKGPLTEAGIKKEYRDLCKMHHPDIGGDESTMKLVNSQYWDRLKSIDGQEQAKTQSWMKSGNIYKFNEKAEQALINKIRQVQNLRLSPTTEVIIDRCWIWIRGATDIEALRLNDKTGIGFRFMEKKPWYDGQISPSYYWHDFENDKYKRKGAKVFKMSCHVQTLGKQANDSGKYIS